MIAEAKTYSRGRIRKAGDILRNESNHTVNERKEAVEIIANWRALHSYPLMVFRNTLSRKANKVANSKDVLIAQRLKRLPSIKSKLLRAENMNLARMQDIGGLRSVMPTVQMVRKLHSDYSSNKNRFLHEFSTFKDYIEYPKSDGYRGLHQVFKYQSQSTPQYNGLQIELQIRSKKQHIWATAVETLGTFLNQGLKTGGGNDQNRRYLALCSALFSIQEKCPPLPLLDLPENELIQELRELEDSLGIIQNLQGFNVAARHIDSGGFNTGAYNLVVLNKDSRRARIIRFTKDQLELANERYSEYEEKVHGGENLEVVLVAAGPIKNLKKAYPNYFLDTTQFSKEILRIIQKKKV